MDIFVTGATGFVGSAVVRELVAAGHRVVGLTRSEEGAQALLAAGAQPHAGSLEDFASLERGVQQADGVIHLGFNHNFANFVQNCENDRAVIGFMSNLLVGSQRPLLVTSGTNVVQAAPGQMGTEQDPIVSSALHPRAATEEAIAAARAQGVNVSAVRLPQVHNQDKHGLISYMIPGALKAGYCAYLEAGQNRWPAAHISDVAELYRLVLEKGQPGANYHAVGEEGVGQFEIAAALGRRLQLPVKSLTKAEAPAYFEWLTPLISHDAASSSAITRRLLGWQPKGPGLIADLG